MDAYRPVQPARAYTWTYPSGCDGLVPSSRCAQRFASTRLAAHQALSPLCPMKQPTSPISHPLRSNHGGYAVGGHVSAKASPGRLETLDASERRRRRHEWDPEPSLGRPDLASLKAPTWSTKHQGASGSWVRRGQFIHLPPFEHAKALVPQLQRDLDFLASGVTSGSPPMLPAQHCRRSRYGKILQGKFTPRSIYPVPVQ